MFTYVCLHTLWFLVMTTTFSKIHSTRNSLSRRPKDVRRKGGPKGTRLNSSGSKDPKVNKFEWGPYETYE